METINKIRINSIKDFADIHSGLPRFCRCVGANSSYITTIEDTDKRLETDNSCVYERISSLPVISEADHIAFYSAAYDRLCRGEKAGLTRNNTAAAFGDALERVLALNGTRGTTFSATMKKNLAVSLMYRADRLPENMLSQTVARRKLIFSLKKISFGEYSFCYLAWLMGMDVLLLLPEGDISLPRQFLSLSEMFTAGAPCDTAVPVYKHSRTDGAVRVSAAVYAATAAGGRSIPPRNERSYEELAALSPSVVMIAASDRNGALSSTGSGVVVSSAGYILTNCHLVAGAAAFDVRLENDSNVYRAEAVIKYHGEMDLALLRINCGRLSPLKVYSGAEPLRRGQRVIAIGSPMGMFNSVSDGIISGFREFGGTDMIQFTAPVSQGSFGGAVLNMNGDVIGIVTANVKGGQNINLAVSYKQIRQFAGNFLEQT